MSSGSVCVLPSYIIVVGDVLFVSFFGMIVDRIFIRCLGSCFASASRFSSDCFFASLICFLNFFLCCVCLRLFSCVGLSSLFWCSWCCLLICFLNLGVYQCFLFFFGLFSYVSIVCWIAFCMLWKCCVVVVFGSDSVSVLVIAVSVSVRMVDLCFSYWVVVSVFCVFVFLGVGLCMMVHVGRWSVMGGEMVPAVIAASVSVVKVQSMRVAVL